VKKKNNRRHLKTKPKAATKKNDLGATGSQYREGIKQSPMSHQMPVRRHLIQALRVGVGGGALAMVTLIGFVYEVWGLVWPTAPIFLPGVPSSGSAFYVPFSVTNKSILFPIRNLTLGCIILNLETKHGNIVNTITTIAIDPVTQKRALNFIEIGTSDSYICKLDINFRASDDVVRASVAFDFGYDPPWI
jgi:hypothetical protein